MTWRCDWTDFARLIPRVCSVTVDSSIAGDPEHADPNQQQIVSAGLRDSLFVIAGPGSGKTTSATLRLLKLVFVDGVEPDAIFATTFTRKAAAELRSRVIAWGEGLRDALSELHPSRASDFDGLDLNKMMIGTLDSLAQEVLNDNKRVGDPRPAPVEEHILATMMLTSGVFPSTLSRTNAGEHHHAAGEFLRQFYNREWSSDPGRATALMEIRQRFQNDQIDVDRLLTSARGTQDETAVSAIVETIQRFDRFMYEAQIYDFSSIAVAFLNRLQSHQLTDITSKLRFVLVDEYQDTNYLQESIYFLLAESACKNGGSITVVGDDDQSLYRFRGATVELFAGFEERLLARNGVRPNRIALHRSYRSTTDIVDFVNEYVRLDPAFQLT